MLNFHKAARVFKAAPKKEVKLAHRDVDPKTLEHGGGEKAHTKEKKVNLEKLDGAAKRFLERTQHSMYGPMKEGDIKDALVKGRGPETKGGRVI